MDSIIEFGIYIFWILIYLLPFIAWIYFFIKKQYGNACLMGLLAILIGGSVGAFIYTASQTTIDKPILYLYPTQTQEISVKLENSELITTSYPKYKDGWKVIAEPNGNLIDIDTGRNLYALYWEEKYNLDCDSDVGFVVSKENVVSFLEEKLAILGLNEREAEEFIVYWLPQLEQNEYNFIHFITEEEINEIIPIEINPKPDTMIRVYMQFKPVNKNYKCLEQELEQRERIGYTSVEWGGTRL